MQVELPKQLTCTRCAHSWTPRKTEVRICPKCKSPFFDRPRREPKPQG